MGQGIYNLMVEKNLGGFGYKLEDELFHRLAISLIIIDKPARLEYQAYTVNSSTFLSISFVINKWISTETRKLAPNIPIDWIIILLTVKLSGDKYNRTPQMSINVPPTALILSKGILFTSWYEDEFLHNK